MILKSATLAPDIASGGQHAVTLSSYRDPSPLAWLTSLVLDLSDSTKTFNGLTPLQVATYLQQFAYRVGFTIDQLGDPDCQLNAFLGDGFLVLFVDADGLPKRQVTGPQRALDLALGLHESVRQLGEYFGPPFNTLRARSSICLGRAIYGSFGYPEMKTSHPGSPATTALTRSVTLTFRISAQSKGGEICVCHKAWECLGNEKSFRADVVRVKGFDKPVVIHRLKPTLV